MGRCIFFVVARTTTLQNQVTVRDLFCVPLQQVEVHGVPEVPYFDSTRKDEKPLLCAEIYVNQYVKHVLMTRKILHTPGLHQ